MEITPPHSASAGDQFIGKYTNQKFASNVDISLSSDKSDTTDQSRKTCDELYAALDDKNHAIEILKRRLTNQQIQLAYYLHKNLAAEAVLEFSNQCMPQLAEDNMQLMLAMYKFIRDTGGKTRLTELRERLSEYKQRVHRALIHQEQLVRLGIAFDEQSHQLNVEQSEEVVEEGRILEGELVNNAENEEMKFSSKAFRLAHLDLCSRLLTTTLQVRRELERFRICAENVVRLEDERNILVDRVFSLPPDQRYGGMRLLMLEHDHHLTYKNNNKSSNHSEASSNATNNLSEKSSKSEESNDIAELTVGSEEEVDDINEQEEDLSSPNIKSSETPSSSEDTISSAILSEETFKDPEVTDEHLDTVLKNMESEAMQLLMLSEKQKNEFALALDSARDENEKLRIQLKISQEAASDERVQQLQEKCIVIEQEIEDMKLGMECEQSEKEEELKQLTDELERREDLEKSLQQELKMLQAKLNILRAEKDLLQRKMESEITNTKTRSADETQSKNDDVEELSMLVNLQEEQIKSLLTILSGLTLSGKGDERNDEPDNEEDVPVVEEESVQFTEESYSNLSSPRFRNCPDKFFSNPSSPRFRNDLDKIPNAEPCNCYFQKVVSDSGNEETPRQIENQSRHRSRSSVHDVKSYNGSKQSVLKSERGSSITTTSVRLESYGKDGKGESLNAVFEFPSLSDGLLELEKSSKLRLRLQCTSPTRQECLEMGSESNKNTCFFCPGRLQVSGDHNRSGVESSVRSSRFERSGVESSVRSSRFEAQSYVTKQLNIITSDMETSKQNSESKRQIVTKLKNIYSRLFGDEFIDKLGS